MNNREEFENWCKTKNIDCAMSYGHYNNCHVRDFWMVWQAARKSAIPNNVTNLSFDAKESLCAMIDYCLENSIGMGTTEGIRDFYSGEKCSFRIEIESLRDILAAAPEVNDARD